MKGLFILLFPLCLGAQEDRGGVFTAFSGSSLFLGGDIGYRFRPDNRWYMEWKLAGFYPLVHNTESLTGDGQLWYPSKTGGISAGADFLYRLNHTVYPFLGGGYGPGHVYVHLGTEFQFSSYSRLRNWTLQVGGRVGAGTYTALMGLYLRLAYFYHR